MSLLISIVVFIIILFLYIHITNQFKKSQDLEVYEMDYKNNIELQKVCDLKQPVIFSLRSPIFQSMTIDYLHSYDTKYVKVKDTNDYYKNGNDNEIISTYIPFSSSHILMKTDPQGHYFIENNDEFVEESGIDVKIAKEMDVLLKPQYSFIIKRTYDICIGSKNAELPLRYHTYYRHFILVLRGKIHVKMTPFKNSSHLEPIEDYNHYEFYSPINVWKKNVENVSFLEFDVPEGNVFYIPSYWWYSIKYSNIEDTIISSCTYHSLINCIAHSPNLAKYYIRQQNQQKKYMKTLEIKTPPDNDTTTAAADTPTNENQNESVERNEVE